MSNNGVRPLRADCSGIIFKSADAIYFKGQRFTPLPGIVLIMGEFVKRLPVQRLELEPSMSRIGHKEGPKQAMLQTYKLQKSPASQ